MVNVGFYGFAAFLAFCASAVHLLKMEAGVDPVLVTLWWVGVLLCSLFGGFVGFSFYKRAP